MRIHLSLRPKWAKARLTNPTKLTMAKMMVRVDECSQANSFKSRPAVPMIMRMKPDILIKFCILKLIIAYFQGRES